MAIEDDILVIKREITGLIDSFRALNKTVGQSITAMGGQVDKNTKAVKDNTAATKDETDAAKKNTRAKQQETVATRSATEAIRDQIRTARETVKNQTQANAALTDFYETQRAQRNYVRELAEAHIDAERKSSRFGSRLVELAGESYSTQRMLLIWGQRLKSAGDSLQEIGKSAAGLAGGLARGETKFTSLNPMIDAAAGAASKLAESIPLLGGALSAAIRLAAEAAKFMNERLQVAVDTFQELSNVGAMTVRGMTGVQEQFIRSGMSLEGFRRTIAANADTLSRFGGTVGRGAEELSRIVGAVIDDRQGMGDELRRLGFSADAIGEAAAGFVEQQTRLGLTQNRSTAELARGAANYARELDALTRLTGMQRDSIQKQQQAALSESRFRAKIDKMVAEGRTGEAKAMLDFQTLFARFPETAKGLRDLMTGFPTSEEAQKVLRMGALGVLRDLESGIIGPAEAFNRFQQAAEQPIKIMRELSLASGDATGFIVKYGEASDFLTARINAAGEVELDQMRQMRKGNDTLTDSAVGAQKALESIGRQMNALSLRILPNFASVIDRITTALNKRLQEMGLGGGLVGAPGAVAGAPSGGAPSYGGPPGTPGGGRTGPGIPGSGGRGGTGVVQAAQLGAIRNMIGRVESGGDYNVLAGGDRADLENMTVREVLELQKKRMAERRPQAAGKYQFQYATLRDMMGPAGVGLDDLFNQSNQDRLADALIRQVGFDQYASNPTPDSKARFLQALATRWRGLPNTPGMQSGMPTDQHGNKAGISWDDALRSFQTGGVAMGPKSGYTALLHGNEAVVPLPDGRTIPVAMPNLDRSMEQQVGMMGAQLVALEELVRYMRENTSISAKILQAANN